MKDFLSSIVLYNFQKFYTYVFIESYNFFSPHLSIVLSSFPLLACSVYMTQIKSVGKDVEKREPSYTVGGNAN